MSERLTEGKHYNYSTWRGDKVVNFMVPVHDPFVHCTMTTKYGWRDRLRILFGAPMSHSVAVEGERDVVSAVMRLARADDGSIELEPVVGVHLPNHLPDDVDPAWCKACGVRWPCPGATA